MPDLFMAEDGDLKIAANGDLAVTDNIYRDDVQASYVRIMTDPGDFTLYPQLGAGLSQLFGLPQSPETGNLGIRLIQSALDRENRFAGKQIIIKATPISYQAIRFDVTIVSGSRQQILLSVIQNLSVK